MNIISFLFFAGMFCFLLGLGGQYAEAIKHVTALCAGIIAIKSI